ncbi:MAG: autotransporter domain-containing protein [Elusimicrobia bacterium]|nr:autotransporter domain-containing protein [Elusimicrobiota bacterium]
MLTIRVLGVLVGGVLSILFLGGRYCWGDSSVNTVGQTWVGGTGNGEWSADENWNLGAPADGDTIHFSGNATGNVNDFSNLSLEKIFFSSGAASFSLAGNTVTFSGDDRTIENNALETQRVGFTGPLVGLEHIAAKSGTLVINSTITSPGARFTVYGGANVIFNRPLLGLEYLAVTLADEVWFNAAVSTSVSIDNATVVINSNTQLPAAEMTYGAILKIVSDVTIGGALTLVEEGFPQPTGPVIDTNGFNLTAAGGIKDGGQELRPAGLTKTGNGVLIVSGDNTSDGWSGGTVIEQGTVRAGTATAFRADTAFSLADTAGATLDLNGFDFTLSELNGGGTQGGTVDISGAGLTIRSVVASSFAGAITGVGGTLTKTGGETFTLTGTNTYSGGTTVSSGTLRGNTLGLQGNILLNNNAAVVFDQSFGGVYAGNLSGSGTLEKRGSGTVTLTGTNSFTGGTSLTEGGLAIGSNVALGTGAFTLNGGTLKTDGVNRTIEVLGDYTQTGGNLQLTLFGPGMNHDRLNVTGVANRGGLLTIGVDPGYLPVGTSTYTLINAGSFGGDIYDFTSGGTALTFQLDYTSTATVLTAIKTPFASFTPTSNQHAVGNYLDDLYPSAEGDLKLVMGQLNVLPEGELISSLKTFSPQPYEAISNVGAAQRGGFSQTLFSQLHFARTTRGGIRAFGYDQGQSFSRWGPLTAAAGASDYDYGYKDPSLVIETKWGAFLTGEASYASLKNDGDLPNGDQIAGGFTTGLDYRFSPHWTLGLGVGYALLTTKRGSDDFNLDGQSFTPGLYGSFNQETYYVDGVMAVQSADFTSTRKVKVGSEVRQAEGTTGSLAFAAGVEAGRPIKKGDWDLVPVAGIHMARQTVDAFNETGAGALSLDVRENVQNSFATHFGARIQHQLTEDTRDRMEIRTAWRHEFVDPSSLEASFAGSPGSFAVAPSGSSKETILLGADFSASLSDYFSFIISYDGDFGETIVNRLHGGLQVRF